MLSFVSSGQAVLLIITIALKTALFAVLILRRVFRDYPLFCAFAMIACLKSWFLFWALRLSVDNYFLVYWPAETLQQTAALAAVIELVWDVLLPGIMLSPRVMRLFSCSVGVILLGICALSHLHAPTPYPILNAHIAFDRASSYFSCGILGVVFTFSALFSVRWRAQAKTIAGGLCALLVTSVIILPVGQYFVTLTRSVSIVFSLSAECLILAVWVRTFAVVSMSSFSMGGRESELLRLLEFGKKLKHEAEIL